MEAALRVTAKLPQHHSALYHGIPVVIEWPKGSVREGKGPDGKPWRRTMNADYGFIDDTEAKGDEEPLDIYIASGDWAEGADPSNPKVYIIEQLDGKGDFDEYKLVAGVPDLETAQELYLSHYPKEWGQDRLGDCYEAALDSLRGKVEEHQEGDGKKTAAQQVPHSSDFDEYVKGELRRQGLPVDSSINWTDYLYKSVARRHSLSQDPDLVFESIHVMLINEIARGSLRSQKVLDMAGRSKNPKVLALPLEKRITWYLKTLFNWRVSGLGGVQGWLSGPSLDPPLERPLAPDVFPAIEEGAELRDYEGGVNKAKEGAFFNGFYRWLIKTHKSPAGLYIRLFSIIVAEFYQNDGHLPFLRDIVKRFNRAQQTVRSDKRWDPKKLESAFRLLPELVSAYAKAVPSLTEERHLPAAILALKRRGDAQYEHRLKGYEADRQQYREKRDKEKLQEEQWMAMASHTGGDMDRKTAGEEARLLESIRGTDKDMAGSKLSGFWHDGPATCMDCVHRTPHSQRKDGTQADSCKHPVVMADPEVQDKKLPDGTIEVDADDWCRFARKPQKGGGGEEKASGQPEKPPRKASIGSIYMKVLGSMD
jgi:hypothetical protein